MRQLSAEKKQADGPQGIRPGVWLFGFALALACVLTIHLSPHQTGRLGRVSPSQVVADQRLSTRLQASGRLRAYAPPRPAVYQTAPEYDSIELQLPIVDQAMQDRRTWVDNHL